MTPKHLTQIWTVLGTLLVYYTLSAWSISQGGQALFRDILFPKAARIESLFALIICSALLVLLSLTGAAYASNVGRVNWAARLPVVRLEGLDTSMLSGKIYQCTFLLVFIFMPLAGLVHFFRRFAEALVIDHDGKEGPFRPFCLLNCPSLQFERYVVGDGLDQGNILKKVADGQTVDWLPIGEPWAILVLLLLAAVSTGIFLFRVFRYSLYRVR